MPNTKSNESDVLLRPSQVAKLIGVNAKTIVRWADAKKIPCVVTLGGHRRFRKSDVDKLIKKTNKEVA